MSRQNPPIGDIGDSLTDCVGKCRASRCREAYHARAYGRPWNQALLDWFWGQCENDPDLEWIASMIQAEAHSRLANQLLPGIERYLGRYIFDEFAVPLSPEPQRPELVVDNVAGTGEEAATAGQGKRRGAAPRRPTGDAA